jgi:uncharacterized repeat protein (TIGR03803 family)
MANPGCVSFSRVRHVFGKSLLSLAFTISALSAAKAQTFTVIHTFQGPDGANPKARLTLDRGGHLYGTTELGGVNNLGTVFKMTSTASGWTLTKIWEFTGYDGGYPLAPVLFGSDGALYGSGSSGGLNRGGVVFKLQPPVTFCRAISCPWTETVLANFYGYYGIGPSGPLTFDASGNIYGTTQLGGDFNPVGCREFGCGIVYELIKSQNWAINNLYSFLEDGDGANPYGGVILDQAGDLYGTVPGDNIFELTPSGGSWTFNVIATLGGNDGDEPYAGLIWDSAGNLYGAAADGGSGDGGTVFQLSPSGGGWNANLLASLSGSGGLYAGPMDGLLMDSAGNLYDTAEFDGAFGCGSVFKLTPSGGGYTFTSLHDFTCGSDGANPYGTLTMDASGNLYGTAAYGADMGCSLGCGVVFKITP